MIGSQKSKTKKMYELENIFFNWKKQKMSSIQRQNNWRFSTEKLRFLHQTLVSLLSVVDKRVCDPSLVARPMGDGSDGLCGSVCLCFDGALIKH